MSIITSKDKLALLADIKRLADVAFEHGYHRACALKTPPSEESYRGHKIECRSAANEKYQILQAIEDLLINDLA